MMRGGGRERIYIDEEVEEGLWYFERASNDVTTGTMTHSKTLKAERTSMVSNHRQLLD